MALTFASIGPVSPWVVPASGRPSLAIEKIEKTQASLGWGMSSGVRTTISATLAAVAGVALHGKGRKASVGHVAACAFDPSKEVGAMDPFGYWDPLHLMREGFKNPDGAYKSEETFRWYRMAEIKHGRISMMAILGLVSGTFFKFGGFEDVQPGLAALNSAEGGAGMGVIVLAAGIFELDIWKQDPSKQPGDFGDPIVQTFGDNPGGGDVWNYSDDMRNRELAHCRLAMSAIIAEFLLEYGGDSTQAQLDFGNWPWGIKLGLLVSFGAWLTYTNDDYYIADDASMLGAGRPAGRAKLLTAGAPAPEAAE